MTDNLLKNILSIIIISNISEKIRKSNILRPYIKSQK